MYVIFFMILIVYFFLFFLFIHSIIERLAFRHNVRWIAMRFVSLKVLKKHEMDD